MTVLEFSLLIWAGSLVAGFLGALTGLGQHYLQVIVGGRLAQGRRPSERGIPIPK